MRNPPESPKSHFRAPSARVTAALAAVMLAIGVAVGAAIGPAPSSSFAVGDLVPLLSSLGAARASSSTPAVQPPWITAEATPRRRKKRVRALKAASTGEGSSAASEAEATTPASTTPTKSGKVKASTLPAVTKVWLIELAGSGFAEATATPSAAPYIDDQAVPSGTLLSSWSALAGSAFANDAALTASTPPQQLDTIVQPPCPEGAAGAQCAPDTPGGLAAADEFLKAALPTITSTAAYREHGLVVVTFASVAVATATGLPAGAATATLTSEPPAGVLMISPFAVAGAKPATNFNTAAPKQSLEKLLRR